MSTPTVVSQLSNLVHNLESWAARLSDSQPHYTNHELSDLDALAARLANAASCIQRKTGSYKPSCRPEIWDASEKLRNQAQSAVEALVRGGTFKQPVLFRRNMILIFGGVQCSDFDSNEMKSRKATTNTRCKQLRSLKASSIVAWAVSYKPTSWAAGCMGKDMFDCLLEITEAKSVVPWPPVVLEVLHKLHNNGLQQSTDFINFLRGEWQMNG
jgi:hypothetical protein